MDEDKIAPDKMNKSIILEIINEDQTTEQYKCNEKTILKDNLTNFSKKINTQFDSLFFLYGGNILTSENINQSIFEIMSRQDKSDSKITILAFKNNMETEEEIRIIMISESNETEYIIENKDKSLKEIFKSFAKKKGLDFDSLIFKYEDQKIDINKNYDDIANSSDKKYSRLIIYYYNRKPVTIHFIHRKFSKYKECFMENKIRDITTEYCLENNMNIKNLIFKHRNNTVDLDKNFYYLNSKEPNEKEDELITLSTNKNKKIIEIMVLDEPSNNKDDDNKKISLKTILIIIGIILGIIIVIIIVIVVLKKNDDNDNSQSSDIINQIDTIKISEQIKQIDTIKITDQTTQKTIVECDPGYFIPDDDLTLEDCKKCSVEGCVKCKGTYSSNECIDCGILESIYEDGKIISCKYICQEGIEDKCLKCLNENECESCNIGYRLVNGKCKIDYFIKAVYQTKTDGENIRLADGTSYIDYMIIDGKQISSPITQHLFEDKGDHIVYFKLKQNIGSIRFYDCVNLISVTYTDFNQYKPGLNFGSLFSRCSKLTSVDFSNIYYDYNVSSSLMFLECESLIYVNFGNKKFISNNKDISSMFYGCSSLTSIDLSNFDVSKITNFEYMFYNCKSLQTINFGNFKLDNAESILRIFTNCISLKSLDLSSFKPVKLKNMYGAFSNCHSLISINLNRFYTSLVTSMSYLFYNCTSLSLIDISSFNTQNIKNMDSMFENCISLTSIIYPTNFASNTLSFIRMFQNCHSLESIDFNFIITSETREFRYMFSNCYSLKSINIQSIELKDDQRYTEMFSGCSSLTSIDLSKSDKITTSLSIVFDDIFKNCPKLNQIQFFKYSSSVCRNIFNKNISESGTISLTETYGKCQKNNIPSNWTLNYYE